MAKPAFTVPLYNDKGYNAANTHLRLNFLLAAFTTLSAFIFLSQLEPLGLTAGEPQKNPTQQVLTANKFWN